MDGKVLRRLVLGVLLLVVHGLAPAQIAVPGVAAPSSAAERLPGRLSLAECEGQIGCTGTWTMDGVQGLAAWANGSTGTLIVERFDEHLTVLCRTDTSGPTAGLRAVYVGWQAKAYGHTELYITGRVAVYWPAHYNNEMRLWNWNAVANVQPSSDAGGILSASPSSSVASCSADFARGYASPVRYWKAGMASSEDKPQDAFVWLYLATQLGDRFAPYSLGAAYQGGIALDSRKIGETLIGEDVLPNESEAYKWFKLSSDRGYTLASDMVADYLYFGEEGFKHSGIAKDLNAAFKLNQATAKKLDSIAMQHIADTYRLSTQDNGAKPDIKDAETWRGNAEKLLSGSQWKCDQYRSEIQDLLPNHGLRRPIKQILIDSVRGQDDFTCKVLLVPETDEEIQKRRNTGLLGQFSDLASGVGSDDWTFTIHPIPGEKTWIARETVLDKFAKGVEETGIIATAISDGQQQVADAERARVSAAAKDFAARVPLPGLPDLNKQVFLPKGTWICTYAVQLLDQEKQSLYDNKQCAPANRDLSVHVFAPASAVEYDFDRQHGVIAIAWRSLHDPEGPGLSGWTFIANLTNVPF
jgi:hypothetical protein